MRLKSKWVILFGILFISCGLLLLVFTQISVNSVEKHSKEILSQIEGILLEKTGGTVDDFSYMQMPAVEIDNEDIIGVIEFKSFGVSLPIGDKWENKKSVSYPKRFSGSVYDNSLIIGGYDCKGQFDCLEKLDIGNRITVTDMTGAQFDYEVKGIERKKSADVDILKEKTSDLTLFVRDSKSLDYIIVRAINVRGSN